MIQDTLIAAHPFWICDEQNTSPLTRGRVSQLEQFSAGSIKERFNQHRPLKMHVAIRKKIAIL